MPETGPEIEFSARSKTLSEPEQVIVGEEAIEPEIFVLFRTRVCKSVRGSKKVETLEKSMERGILERSMREGDVEVVVQETPEKVQGEGPGSQEGRRSGSGSEFLKEMRRWVSSLDKQDPKKKKKKKRVDLKG